jgi:hypothetical protein
MRTAATTRAGIRVLTFERRIGRHAGRSRTGRFSGVERPALPAHLRRRLHPLFLTRLFTGPSGAASEANDKERSSGASSMSCSLRAGARRSGSAPVAAGASEPELTAPTAK